MFNQDQIANLNDRANAAMALYFEKSEPVPNSFQMDFDDKIVMVARPTTGETEILFQFRYSSRGRDLQRIWLDEAGHDSDPVDWIRDNS